jgi:diguanylate cyclase (GGDEF)-like protein
MEYRAMSQSLETLDGRPNCFASAIPRRSDPRDSTYTALTRACDQAALDVCSESMLFFSALTTCILRANRAACQFLGYEQHQMQNMRIADVAPQVTASNLAQLCNRALRSVYEEAAIRTVYRHQTRTLLPVEFAVRRVASLPEDVFVALARERFQHTGEPTPRIGNPHRDSLTGLPDRTWLWQRLEHEFDQAQHAAGQLAVLFIDIDQFKQINDTNGHLAGDQVLQAFARRLSKCVRPNDAVARCGGDEFVVILSGVHGPDVRRVAERIGRSFEVKGNFRGGTEWRAQVAVSIGVAISRGEDSSSVDLFERADRAMYQAKALGRAGRFVIDDSTARPPLPAKRLDRVPSPLAFDSSDELF